MVKNEKAEGFGIMFKENGTIKSGNFKNGKLCGHGKHIFNKGNIFIGKFFEDQMDVKGYFYDKINNKWFIFNESNFVTFKTLKKILLLIQ